ncbi:hypothetical protein ADM98_05485 [Exiguobacterium sp. BMC-KP]|uniref:hypothetical protein n=1 Tax=Exiguobacterium sp. BMC-KP TaxID=1684312 RepID=UPI0006AA5290|nr:hypothetical protein [Exiguobacterium sp. BMC-KP]KOP30894.1 hypothetical protein ADM98_05485 [Exiguobacterium sp. BMC-KP]
MSHTHKTVYSISSATRTRNNNNIAILKVFFNYLVEEEFIEELSNLMRRIKSLKEEKRVNITFIDDEVKQIITDVEEETYANV